MEFHFLESYNKKKSQISEGKQSFILSAIFHMVIIILAICLKVQIETLQEDIVYNVEILPNSQNNKLLDELEEDDSTSIEEGDEFNEDDIIDEASRESVIVAKNLKESSKKSDKPKTIKPKRRTYKDQLASMPKNIRSQINDLYATNEYDKLISFWFEQYRIMTLKSVLNTDDVYALLRVRIKKSGDIVYYKLEQGTGIEELDKGILSMAGLANPAPPIPDDYTDDAVIEFILPIVFTR